MAKANTIKAVLLGILSALFLSTGLIVNSLNAFHGGNWAWTACLRYLLLLPVLLLLVAARGKLTPLFQVLKHTAGTFLLWGCVGFGGYYALLSYAITMAPGWLVTAGFMTTVLAGILISPFIYKDHRAIISRKALLLSCLLVISLFTMQFERLAHLHDKATIGLSMMMAIVAAFLWPLGNRKLLYKLETEGIQLDPMQRVLGMTIGSLPVQIALAAYGYHSSGMPSALQLQSSVIAVLFSGVFGSILFYKAMQQAGKHFLSLLTVEATQVLGVLFTLLGEMFFKGTPWPGLFGTLGLVMMLIALGVYIWLSAKNSPAIIKQQNEQLSFQELSAAR
ncbi:multidrug resistance efflux transporter family protein [Mucilaginibacter sp. Bleaf8]|uniref:multidrug resistance efflux transporter family protein n=1 Tax=Mucilaginibacter sp. Bleaf8 TaxID=2834430 RepID=UPI001BCC3471|nr:multidrug resistance efflux transporter family protein [Mucilaginibacter sp. Bleaf8]MBS7566917.1 multidrug resistance efflux transporter family protein [Mucilaginibacter sp. Bleaf8]